MTPEAHPHTPFQKLPAPFHRSVASWGFVSADERAQLLKWARARTTPHRLVVRSRIVLLAIEGLPIRDIAARLHVAPATVRLWCRRFHHHGLAALNREAPGRGRPPGMTRDVVLDVLKAMQMPAEHGGTWTARVLAERAGTSASTVWRVWKQHLINPRSSAAEIARALEKALSETR